MENLTDNPTAEFRQKIKGMIHEEWVALSILMQRNHLGQVEELEMVKDRLRQVLMERRQKPN